MSALNDQQEREQHRQLREQVGAQALADQMLAADDRALGTDLQQTVGDQRFEEFFARVRTLELGLL